jgi:hypothetical protein
VTANSVTPKAYRSHTYIAKLRTSAYSMLTITVKGPSHCTYRGIKGELDVRHAGIHRIRRGQKRPRTDSVAPKHSEVLKSRFPGLYSGQNIAVFVVSLAFSTLFTTSIGGVPGGGLYGHFNCIGVHCRLRTLHGAQVAAPLLREGVRRAYICTSEYI